MGRRPDQTDFPASERLEAKNRAEQISAAGPDETG